jgi:hypothetical protein
LVAGLPGKPAGTGLRCPETKLADPREDACVIMTKDEIVLNAAAKKVIQLMGLTGKEDMILSESSRRRR